jgi:hypothetical protein
MAKKGKPQPIEREYLARGISAHPDWWKLVEDQAAEMGVNRSAFIRLAVNDYLKEPGQPTQKEKREKAAA